MNQQQFQNVSEYLGQGTMSIATLFKHHFSQKSWTIEPVLGRSVFFVFFLEFPKNLTKELARRSIFCDMCLTISVFFEFTGKNDKFDEGY